MPESILQSVSRVFTLCVELVGCYAWSASAVLDGLALDAAHHKLYYADAGSVGKIGEVSTDGKHHRVLVTERNSKPRSIVLDPSNR